MGNNAPCKVVGVGTVKCMFDRAIRVLGNVRHMPELWQNLISLSYLEVNGCTFKAAHGVLKVCRVALVAMKGACLQESIYMLKRSTLIGEAAVATLDECTTDDTLL